MHALQASQKIQNVRGVVLVSGRNALWRVRTPQVVSGYPWAFLRVSETLPRVSETLPERTVGCDFGNNRLGQVFSSIIESITSKGSRVTIEAEEEYVG